MTEIDKIRERVRAFRIKQDPASYYQACSDRDYLLSELEQKEKEVDKMTEAWVKAVSENSKIQAAYKIAVEDITRLYLKEMSCDICKKHKICDLKDCSVGFCLSFEYRDIREKEGF